MSTGRSIRLVQLARASQSSLWRACATTEGLARWQADRVLGHMAQGQKITLQWPALQMELELDVKRVKAPELLVLENDRSLVELRVEPGSITMTQAGLPEDADIDGFASSWRVGLSLLAHGVEEYPDVDREVTWFVRRVRTTPELAYLLFTEGPGLGVWLGESAGIGPTGSECSIRLSDDIRLDGRVLARVAGRDVALGFRSRQCVLVLRTLPSPFPGERVVALTCSTFGRSAAEHGDMLAGAFERLMQALARGGSA